MRQMPLFALVALLSLVGCGSPSCDTKSESTCDECPDCCSVKNRAAMLQKSTEELKAITSEQLTKEIETHAGKVVCVFVWGCYHRPSIAQLPEVAALQTKYAKDGLVFMTVCHAPQETRKMAMQMLQKAKCGLPSFAIDDNEIIDRKTIWQDLGLPAMIVIGRDGKKTARLHTLVAESTYNLPAIEEAVEKALSTK